MFLLDTNIWLERLLGQEQMEVVETLLNTLNTDEICITDFCLHSIGVILGRLKKRPAFVQYVQDVLIDGHVLLVRIPPEKMLEITAVMDTFQLDFDDAYQYVAAQQVKATIIVLRNNMWIKISSCLDNLIHNSIVGTILALTKISTERNMGGKHHRKFSKHYCRLSLMI